MKTNCTALYTKYDVSINEGSIPESGPEKRPTHPRKAAGTQITQSQNGEVVTKNNNTGLL